MKLSQLGEFGLIDQIKRGVSTSKSVIHGIGDDAAVVKRTTTTYELLTTDMLIEDKHFTLKMSPQDIGHKALACNLSDIAAMGGKPKFALVSLGVSPAIPTDFIRRIYLGMGRLAGRYGVAIVGGDTVKSDKLILNVALTGKVKKNRLVTRAGAKPGDLIVVTGPLGNSFTSGHHLKFIPRLAESKFLVRHNKPSAMIDLSDGLASDLRHILKTSQVGAVLYEHQIPLRRDADVEGALTDGEDFELCFTIIKRQFERLIAKSPKEFSFIPVGKILPQREGFVLEDEKKNRRPIVMRGFRHF